MEVLANCGARLCALGADGDVLLSAGLTPHVVPAEASTQGLVKELVARGEAAGARVLCPVLHVSGECGTVDGDVSRRAAGTLLGW